jgi:hypothetical protein
MDGGRNLTFGKKYGYKRDWKAAQRYGIERVFFFLLKIVIYLFIKWS